MPDDRERRVWLRIAHSMCIDAMVVEKAQKLLEEDEATPFLTTKERRAMRALAAGRRA